MPKTFAYHIALHIGSDILTLVKIGEPIEQLAARLSMSPEETAAMLLRSRPEHNSDLAHYSKTRPEDIKSIRPMPSESIHGFTIRFHNEQYNFDWYTYPEGECRVMLHRHDENTSEDLSNDFIVPSNVVNADYTGEAVKRLFEQIAEEYVEAQRLRSNPEFAGFNWHDFIGIPEQFMKKYGVQPIAHPDIMCDITVTANKPIVTKEA